MRKIKRLIPLLLALVMLLALAACGQNTETPPTDGVTVPPDENVPADSGVQIPVEAPPPETGQLCFAYFPAESLNPFTCENIYNESLVKLVYEGLFALDGDFNARAALCSKWTTEDSLTWVFDIKPDVYFHNGQALTADDVVYSLKYSGLINGSISKTGDLQVTVSLRHPNENLPNLLTCPIVPSGAAEEDRPSGTGPFKYVGYGEYTSLGSFAAWHGSADMPLRIALFPAERIADVTDAFGAGKVSAVITGYGAYEVGFTVDCDIWDCPTTIMHYIGFNCHKGHCSDARLRYALQFAIDRDAIAIDCLDTSAVEAVVPVNPMSSLYDEELHGKYSFSPEKFAAAMDDMFGGDVNENGYWDLSGWDVELDIAVNGESGEKVRAAEEIVATLDELGIKSHLYVMSWQDFNTALENRSFDLYYGEVRLTDDFSLIEILDGSLNYGNFTLADQWDDFYEYFFARAPIVSVCFENHSVLTRRGEINGVYPVQGNIYNDIEKWEFN